MRSTTTSRSTDAQSLDTILKLLRNKRRRYALAVLSEQNRSVPLRDLAEEVAAREAETDGDRISPETTDRVATSLHHVHLPKLSDADAVAYDEEAKTVSLVQVESFAPFLRATGQRR